MADNSQLKMLYGLWRKLKHVGAISDSSDRHLSAFLKRMTGVERGEWLNVEQAIVCIEGLKGWLARGIAKCEAAEKE
jgi:hypothetical protein